MVGMKLPPEPDDDRVDLNRIDVLRSVSERCGHVRARSGAEHEDVLERVAEHHVGPLVEVLLLIDRGHRLVKDVVDLDDGVGAVLADGDLVVRGPERAASHDVDQDERKCEEPDVDGREPRRRRRAALTAGARRLPRQQER